MLKMLETFSITTIKCICIVVKKSSQLFVKKTFLCEYSNMKKNFFYFFIFLVIAQTCYLSYKTIL